jgi:hypothetical protein
MSPASNTRDCYLGIGINGRTLHQMAKDPNFGTVFKALTPWDALPSDLRMPLDASVSEVFQKVEAGDPTLAPGSLEADLKKTISNVRQLPGCQWTGADTEELANKFVNAILPNTPFAPDLECFRRFSRTMPCDTLPTDWENNLRGEHDQLLIRDEDNNLGFAQKWQGECASATCPESTFRDGQIVVLTEARRWQHFSRGATECDPAPVRAFSSNCHGCGEPFKDRRDMFVDLLFNEQFHRFSRPSGAIFTCAGTSLTAARAVIDQEDSTA